MKGMRALVILGALFVGLDFAFADDCIFDEEHPPANVAEYMSLYKINGRHFNALVGKAECLESLAPEAKVLVVSKDDGGFKARVARRRDEVGDIEDGAFFLAHK